MKAKYKCCKCDWTGTDEEKNRTPDYAKTKNWGVTVTSYCCPVCGHDEFTMAKTDGQKLVGFLDGMMGVG